MLPTQHYVMLSTIDIENVHSKSGQQSNLARVEQASPGHGQAAVGLAVQATIHALPFSFNPGDENEDSKDRSLIGKCVLTTPPYVGPCFRSVRAHCIAQFWQTELLTPFLSNIFTLSVSYHEVLCTSNLLLSLLQLEELIFAGSSKFFIKRMLYFLAVSQQRTAIPETVLFQSTLRSAWP